MPLIKLFHWTSTIFLSFLSCSAQRRSQYCEYTRSEMNFDFIARLSSPKTRQGVVCESNRKLQILFWILTGDCVSGEGSICEHNNVRYECKDFGKSSICEHNRRRKECKACGGSSICEHKRLRRQCKQCGGASICEHNRQRSSCKECRGGSICMHNRRRNECKVCGGAKICEHNRLRYRCKECGGASICEHRRQRSGCKDCGGGSICEHNRRRGRCKECGTASGKKRGAEQHQPESIVAVLQRGGSASSEDNPWGMAVTVPVVTRDHGIPEAVAVYPA
eukprot:915927-Rhodomonas_salina.1